MATEQSSDERGSELGVLLLQLVGKLVPVFCILALWVPFEAVAEIVRPLAGKDTTVAITVSFALSIAIGVTASAGLLAFWRRDKAQTREIQRLRERNRYLEGLLEAKERGIAE